MQSERPRARRYPFVATIEVTDVGTETQFIGQTNDVSVYGCGVNTQQILPKQTTVRVRIIHAGMNFVALGKVTYANPDAGIGVAFTQVEPNQQAILEKWINQLKEMHA